jgi:hypothetical protein
MNQTLACICARRSSLSRSSLVRKRILLRDLSTVLCYTFAIVLLAAPALCEDGKVPTPYELFSKPIHERLTSFGTPVCSDIGAASDEPLVAEYDPPSNLMAPTKSAPLTLPIRSFKINRWPCEYAESGASVVFPNKQPPSVGANGSRTEMTLFVQDVLSSVKDIDFIYLGTADSRTAQCVFGDPAMPKVLGNTSVFLRQVVALRVGTDHNFVSHDPRLTLSMNTGITYFGLLFDLVRENAVGTLCVLEGDSDASSGDGGGASALSPGAIAGIVCGLLAILTLGIVGFCCLNWMREKRLRQPPETNGPPVPVRDFSTLVPFGPRRNVVVFAEEDYDGSVEGSY